MDPPSARLRTDLSVSIDSLSSHASRLASASTSTDGTDDRSTMSTPLPSPSASTFLRTAATLEGLSKQLGRLKDESVSGDEEVRCCCGATGSGSGTVCAMWIERDRMEDKLKLSGEIGDALLQRYEALERKHQREVEKFERQLEIKRTALAESVRRVNNLEKANGTHMARFTEVSKKNEALEKRYTQALHTQTLTQQSLTHVRAELTALRNKAQKQTFDKVTDRDAADRIGEAERRYEDMRDACEVESRAAKEESRKRKRADARVEELQGQLEARSRELEEVRAARTKDAQELLANAKERLTILHSELSETFRADSPADAPEYQKTLEDLVASNALLKHDASELSLLLNDSRDEVRNLKEEIDELRAVVGVAGRLSPDNLPSSRRLASELMRSHNRTESSPNVGHNFDRGSWARMSVHIPSSSRIMEQHMRKSSLAPSFTSSSSYNDTLNSPGLGMGPVGEYGGGVITDGAQSPTIDGRESPKPMFRASPSGSIGYVLNGVPKSKTTLPRPPVRRATSGDRPRPIRTYSPSAVNAIAEWGPSDPNATPPQPEEPMSPGESEYSRAAEASRKRRSILLSRASTRNDGELSPNASNTLVDQSVGGDLTSPTFEDPSSPRDAKRVNRRTLLLLTKSQGTQTDPVVEQSQSVSTSTATSPQPHFDGSETSSLHEARDGKIPAGILTALVEHLAKTLTKIRTADIATLNKRLKKQHLPGDVSHLSRSTLRVLQSDVAEFRSAFKGVGDMQVNKREFTLLLKLLKDVFGELVELQAVVNDVTIDPSLAKKLQKEAYRDEELEEAKQKSGLGWIAAPITKFFVTPAQEREADSTSKDRAGMARVDRSKLAGTVRAPKQLASTSATTTHVSVEFGGAGIVRRATPAAPVAAGVMALPPSPDPTGDTSFVSSSSGGESLMPPAVGPGPGTLRPSKSRANRNELLGIFAGAGQGRVSPSNNWVVLPPGQSSISPIPQRQLRAASSQYFGDKTVRARPTQDTASRKKLSSAVDAVIDRTANQIDESDPATVGSYEPPLLERTLRPRGLSDSSIRSTFIAHDPGLSRGMGMGLGTSVGEEKKGYLESFANRFYPFRASQNDPPPGSSPSDRPGSPPPPVQAPKVDVPILTRQAPSPARPIPAARTTSKSSMSSSTGASSPGVSGASGAGSMAQSQSLFGMLASSITAAAAAADVNVNVEEGDEEAEADLRGARLRRGMSGRVGSGKTAWR